MGGCRKSNRRAGRVRSCGSQRNQRDDATLSAPPTSHLFGCDVGRPGRYAGYKENVLPHLSETEVRHPKPNLNAPAS